MLCLRRPSAVFAMLSILSSDGLSVLQWPRRWTGLWYCSPRIRPGIRETPYDFRVIPIGLSRCKPMEYREKGRYLSIPIDTLLRTIEAAETAGFRSETPGSGRDLRHAEN